MKPAICEQFGIDFPPFAFSHCRDVVAAVTNAGGFGVLGATAFTPQWLDQELSWIDEHVGGKSPQGVAACNDPAIDFGDHVAGSEPGRRGGATGVTSMILAPRVAMSLLTCAPSQP